MAWTSPKTWTSEPLTSLDLNTYVRDNQKYLRERLDTSVSRLLDGDGTLNSTATNFVDVDENLLALQLDTNGGEVLLGFVGSVRSHRSGGTIFFNVAVDGVDYVQDDGIMRVYIQGALRDKPMSFVMLISGLSAGQHSFKLRWKVAPSHTARMDISRLHPQFWAKEI